MLGIGVVSACLLWARGTKDYSSGDFGLKQSNAPGTSFLNGIMWLQVFVLWCGLYIAFLSMIFCRAQSYIGISVYTKFGLIWNRLASTFFTKVQLDQKCKVGASLTSGGWIWLKFCVAWLFGMVHMCIKFHSHWTYRASTCFTMLPTD